MNVNIIILIKKLMYLKHKIKDEIKNSSNPSDIKLKRTFDEIFQEIGYICHIEQLNKQLFPDIKTFDEVPNESEYYKTIRNENFMIFKDSNIIIFQSPFQAKLFMYHKNIFADVEYYKNMEAELKNIGCGKNDIIEN
ncbi:hypothetical protein PIROE2DRAFT_9282 [Piromyces sp. E2]|nr:hypothetical protein PIROE2DRAFT_9282 [Piromyces sp. E2]|eukprot:OUM64051.1 hypothetical protein PIROE2DRAFT_9282 [Piromyces sp. E2]